jgi:hypothetical protein
MKIETKFDISDKVIIDGASELVAVITAITWRNENQINYEVSWFCQGKLECNVIEHWRLGKA